ncbi:MAG: hypothetical protein R3C10_21400 [Pirellulales bacterium]
MFRAILRTHLRQSWRSLRLLAVLVAALTLGFLGVEGFGSGGSPQPGDVVSRLAKSHLLVGIVVGGCLVGWRLAQLPKSRALEFTLVAPGSDWEFVGAEVLVAAVRTVVVLSAPLPLLVMLASMGWFDARQATTIYAVPIAAGTLAGLGLAVVAYEPMWVRKSLERLLLATIVLYLVCCGLFGAAFVPWLSRQWHQWQLASGMFSTSLAVLGQLNPFRLTEEVGSDPSSVTWFRAGAVVSFLLALSAACACRLVRRLRPHHYEENYDRQFDRRAYQQAVGDRPLSWWTARRVSRFKGNVNLYLAWATVGLYSSWLVLADRWPPWLATQLLWMIESFGGGAILAAAAVQLAVVPTAFLNGLWDSNEQQRARRLELLLVTPLGARQYLWASVTAAWCRGRGYVLAALVLWAAALHAGRISSADVITLCAVSAVYMLLSFSVMFRFFARTDSDHDVTVRGIFWSVGLPLLTAAVYQSGATAMLAASPLGAIYLLSLPAAAREQLLGAEAPGVMHVVWAAQAFYLCLSVVLLRRALASFDHEIREWFANHCVSVHVRRQSKRTRRPRAVPSSATVAPLADVAAPK